MGLLSWWRSTTRPEPGPFACVWCADEGRHDMCTGKAVRPHLERAALFSSQRVMTAVEDCSCSLAGHELPQGGARR